MEGDRDPNEIVKKESTLALYRVKLVNTRLSRGLSLGPREGGRRSYPFLVRSYIFVRVYLTICDIMLLPYVEALLLEVLVILNFNFFLLNIDSFTSYDRPISATPGKTEKIGSS